MAPSSSSRATLSSFRWSEKPRAGHKGARNRNLTLTERAANRQVSSVRSKVERAFGTFKRGYGFFRARYLGVAKVELEYLLNAMAFNLKKAVLRLAC